MLSHDTKSSATDPVTVFDRAAEELLVHRLTELRPEDAIVGEFAAVRGNPVDLGGYYHGDDDKIGAVMRSSATLNGIIG